MSEWKPIATLPPKTSAYLRGPRIKTVLYSTDGKWPDPDHAAKGYTEWADPTWTGSAPKVSDLIKP